MMHTTALPAARRGAMPWLEPATRVLLVLFAIAIPISIAAAQSLLALALAGWVTRLVRDGARPDGPPFFLALAAYAGATLVSVVFSADPLVSLSDSRQLLLFLIVPLVYDVARGATARTVLDAVLAVGAASALYGIVQYGLLQYDHLGQRPRGALSHYMTYSGILMLVLCAATARLVFATRDRTWPALLMPALVVALALTFTRSAWVGACVAVALILALRDRRLLAGLPVVVALLFALAPAGVAGRMVSMFDLHDPTNRDRLAMLRAGTAMIADHPLTGVGPDMVDAHYPRYRDATAVEPVHAHLHNVPLQIAAERGLPALAAWAWCIAWLVLGLVRQFRAGPDRVLPALGLAATAAMLTAGLFEYNFGDSEFLMLFLLLVTLPFAAARPPHAAAGARA
jgi:O-antigen ligase